VKIIFVHNSYQQRGGEDVVFEQEVELLRNHGHAVILYRRSNSEINGYTRLRHAILAKNAIWSNETQADVTRLIRREKPDLVHVHNTFLMISPSIYSACVDTAVPVVQTLHNYRLLCPGGNLMRNGHTCDECVRGTLLHSVVHGCYRDSRPATATVALMLAAHRALQTWTSMVDRYIALSQFAARQFIKGGLSAQKIAVKPNFVLPDPGMGNGSGDYALFIGRLSSEKGPDILVRAWKHLRACVPLLIVGDGEMRERLEAQVHNDPRVKFCGQMRRAEVFEALKHARFVVFPSRNYESFPMTIAEAYACGVPVIASAMGVMEELVADGRTGLLFRAGDAEALANQVDWAWSHPNDLKHMRHECRREFELQYSAERNYQLLMAIYDRVLSGNGCRSSNGPRTSESVGEFAC
jgi:glycosyltransferase involved in cell wall biosynthesis